MSIPNLKVDEISKVIIGKNPHNRYITDLWYLSNNISKDTGYNLFLVIVDYFTECIQGYCLEKNK